MHPRGLHVWIAGLLLVSTSACEVVERVRGREAPADTAAAPAPPRGSPLVLRMETPGVLRPGEEGTVRVTVTNRGDSAVHGVRLDLFVPGWLEPAAPAPGSREVTMAASVEEGHRLSYGMDEPPLRPGQPQTVEQRVRVPATSPTARGAQPWGRVIRARLTGPGGEPLTEVESAIAFDTAAARDTARLARTPANVARRDRLGPVRLGVTAAELRRAAPGTRDTTWTSEGMTERGQVVPLGGGGRAVMVLSGDTVSRIEVRDTLPRTRENLGVGSTFEALRATYGRACADVGEEGRVVVWFPTAPGISFALDMRAPSDPAQLRANPDRIPGASRVTRWWLGPGADRCP